MTVEEEEPRDMFSMTKMILSGQYTYLTYLIMSSTCFFMWLAPNYNKLKMFFKGGNNQPMTYAHARRNSNLKRAVPARTMQTRSSAKYGSHN